MPQPAIDHDIIRIYRETIGPLHAYISRRCGGDRDLTEDIVQETWLRAVRDWKVKGVPATPIAWLSTVGRNHLLNEFRKGRPVSLESIPPAEILKAIEDPLLSESADTAALVTEALSHLPARQSWLLEAFYLDRWRTSRIAGCLGISERAVEGRLRRARENLRRELRLTTPD